MLGLLSWSIRYNYETETADKVQSTGVGDGGGGKLLSRTLQLFPPQKSLQVTIL